MRTPVATPMIELLQKVWYNDGSMRLQAFRASSLELAMALAYEALDGEIARQWESGRVTVDRAVCGEPELVSALS